MSNVRVSDKDKIRFLEKVAFGHGPNACWFWFGGQDRKGYGKFWWGGQTGRAQRFAVLAWKGEFPPHFDTDHLCRNIVCVHPFHLEPVPRRTNLLRGFSPVGINAAKTHCKYGHPFDLENTLILKDGERRCRACSRIKMNRLYRENPEKFRQRKRDYDDRKKSLGLG